MTTIVEFPDQSVVAEEAAQWLIRLDGDAPPAREELRALSEWLRRSPAHREKLESLAVLWGRMNVLTELAVPLGNSARSIARIGSDRTRRPAVAFAGAVFALMLTLAVLLFAREPDIAGMSGRNGLYATAVGQQATTTLPDGSTVILNTNSQMKVDYDAGYRRVHLLQGEALFTVAKNPQRPFRVYAGGGRVEAVGTAFSVYLEGAKINVTVTEGRVALAAVNPRSPVPPSAKAVGSPPDVDAGLLTALGTLDAGQVATIRTAVADSAADTVGVIETVEPITRDQMAQRLAWREGVLVFSGDRLEDVVTELSRYTTMSIEIPDADVRNMRIGGRFTVGEIDAMLSALRTNFGLRVTYRTRNRVILSAQE